MKGHFSSKEHDSVYMVELETMLWMPSQEPDECFMQVLLSVTLTYS